MSLHLNEREKWKNVSLTKHCVNALWMKGNKKRNSSSSSVGTTERMKRQKGQWEESRTFEEKSQKNNVSLADRQAEKVKKEEERLRENE